MAAMTLIPLGFRGLPFHDPFHGPGSASHVGQEIELARGYPNRLSKAAAVRSAMSTTVRDLYAAVKAVRAGRR
jgi:hypothetical protein